MALDGGGDAAEVLWVDRDEREVPLRDVLVADEGELPKSVPSMSRTEWPMLGVGASKLAIEPWPGSRIAQSSHPTGGEESP